MPDFTVLAIAVALAMDAFAVSIASAAALPELTGARLLRMSVCFGVFQGGMPLLGYLLGVRVQALVSAYAHWLALLLLCAIGGKMIYDSMQDDEQRQFRRDPTRGWLLISLAVATSIDALVVGITFGVLARPIGYPALVIGVVTLLFSAAGMVLGHRAVALWGRRAEVAAGLLLCLLGIKIVLEHV